MLGLERLLLVAFGFVGFCIRYNGSVSLSAYLGRGSHYWGCETEGVLRTKKNFFLKRKEEIQALEVVTVVSCSTFHCSKCNNSVITVTMNECYLICTKV